MNDDYIKDVYTNVYYISGCTITPTAAWDFPFNADVINVI